MLLWALVIAPAAPASSHHPKGEYEAFGECPLSVTTITGCVRSVTRSGKFKVGTKTVPLSNPVTLQGGAEGGGEEVKFYGAENGETLSKAPQPVPGGLVGVAAPADWPKSLQEWFDVGIKKKSLFPVEAFLELTGPTKGLTDIKLDTEHLLTREGTALMLPARISLANALLGSTCYIGSESSPIQLNLTSGPSSNLQGKPGNFSYNKTSTLVTVKGGKLVDGTYSVPTASGCGGIYSFLVDPLVNSVLGLPSGSRNNEAVLEGVLQDAQAEAVKTSE